MAFNFPYQTLSVQELRHLTGKDNREARKIFIDCLSMLQEILLDVSASSVRPSLKSPDVAAAILEELVSNFPQLTYVAQSAYDTTSESSKLAESAELRQRIITELRKNKETALELRREYISPSLLPTGARNRAEASGFIEAFLSTLADQYDNLRYPNTAAIPA